MKMIISSVLTGVVIALLAFSCEHEKDNNNLQGLTGKLINNSDCKNLKPVTIIDTIPDSLSCVDYSYEPSNHKLLIKHINAGFNCCPDGLYCNATLSNDTIIIQEFENDQLCNCECLFDLEIEITGVTPEEYLIKFIEPYCGDQEQIIFEVDLISEFEGSYCVTRNQYPWGG
jgi:hypothetical protein